MKWHFIRRSNLSAEICGKLLNYLFIKIASTANRFARSCDYTRGKLIASVQCLTIINRLTNATGEKVVGKAEKRKCLTTEGVRNNASTGRNGSCDKIGQWCNGGPRSSIVERVTDAIEQKSSFSLGELNSPRFVDVTPATSNKSATNPLYDLSAGGYRCNDQFGIAGLIVRPTWELAR